MLLLSVFLITTLVNCGGKDEGLDMTTLGAGYFLTQSNSNDDGNNDDEETPVEEKEVSVTMNGNVKGVDGNPMADQPIAIETASVSMSSISTRADSCPTGVDSSTHACTVTDGAGDYTITFSIKSDKASGKMSVPVQVYDSSGTLLGTITYSFEVDEDGTPSGYSVDDVSPPEGSSTNLLAPASEQEPPTVTIQIEGDDSDDNTSGGITNVTSDQTWSGDISVDGIIYVQSGATITIEAGTLIKATEGSYIFFLPGSALDAVGTSSSPIVFTSSKTEGSRNPGDWGGLLFIGNGDISEDGIYETEGDDSQQYPGEEAVSINMQYVRVEFAGSVVGESDELNGISLYAVTNTGNTFDHIQVHMGLDDGIECFGGSLNMSNLLITASDDDGLDLDMGYQGTITNVVVEQYPTTDMFVDSLTANGFEFDGGKSNVVSNLSRATTPTITNFLLIGGNQVDGYGLKAREGTDITNITGGLIYGFEAGAVYLDDGDNITCPVGPASGFSIDTSSVRKDDCSSIDVSGITMSSTEKANMSAADANYDAVSVDYSTDSGSHTFTFTGEWNNYSLH